MGNPSGPPGGSDKPPGQYRIVRVPLAPAGADLIKQTQNELEQLEQQGFEWLQASGSWIYLYKNNRKK